MKQSMILKLTRCSTFIEQGLRYLFSYYFPVYSKSSLLTPLMAVIVGTKPNTPNANTASAATPVRTLASAAATWLLGHTMPRGSGAGCAAKRHGKGEITAEAAPAAAVRVLKVTKPVEDL